MHVLQALGKSTGNDLLDMIDAQEALNLQSTKSGFERFRAQVGREALPEE